MSLTKEQADVIMKLAKKYDDRKVDLAMRYGPNGDHDAREARKSVAHARNELADYLGALVEEAAVFKVPANFVLAAGGDVTFMDEDHGNRRFWAVEAFSKSNESSEQSAMRAYDDARILKERITSKGACAMSNPVTKPFSLESAKAGAPFGRLDGDNQIPGELLKSDVPGRKPLLVAFNNGQTVEHYTNEGQFALYRKDSSDLVEFAIGYDADGVAVFYGDRLIDKEGGFYRLLTPYGVTSNNATLVYKTVLVDAVKRGMVRYV